MNAFDQMREEEGLSSLYVDNLEEKARVHSRRKKKFRPNGKPGVRTHWENHSGRFRDPETRTGPKFWTGRKPPTIPNPINSYHDLADAVRTIANGEANAPDYAGVTGLARDRLRLAQSWRDRGISYDVSDVVSMSFDRIRTELGFGRPGGGRKKSHSARYMRH